MATIGSELASEIVERTMKIIPFNVNVMDERGIIIGSGNRERIGSLHPGAQLALAKQETVEIDSAATPTLAGAKAGINLPLTVRGAIRGVIGITGNPDEVRQFGELVRITAEMILEQALLIGELQHEKRYREEFVVQLASKSGIAATSMQAWAARLRVNLQQAHAFFVLQLASDLQRPDLTMSALQEVQSELASHWPELLTAVISPGELAIFEAFAAADSPDLRAVAARKRLQALDEVIRKKLQLAACLAMGIALPGLAGALSSYESAKQTARIGRQRFPEATTFSYYDLSLPVLLAGLAAGWQAEQLRQPLARLAALDGKGQVLLKTLQAWFSHDTQPAQTASALHIHRNTLDYRLQKIGSLTGLNLANTDDRLLLYVALQLRSPD